jgi:hypothetical protein
MWMGAAGCAGRTHIVTQRVDIPVPVPCRVELPPEPITLTIADDIVSKVKALLAEIEGRQGYEAELRAAAEACG